MDAIVYTSNTGYTEQYALMLGEKTGLPVYTLKTAKASLPKGSAIIYLGWLMAGAVKGASKAKKLYELRALCAVGMSDESGQRDEVAKKYPGVEVFNLQGGFDINKLHGIYRFMMNAMAKGVGGKLQSKPDRTPQEDDMLDLMLNGGSRVSEEKLQPVLDWYEANK